MARQSDDRADGWDGRGAKVERWRCRYCGEGECGRVLSLSLCGYKCGTSRCLCGSRCGAWRVVRDAEWCGVWRVACGAWLASSGDGRLARRQRTVGLLPPGPRLSALQSLQPLQPLHPLQPLQSLQRLTSRTETERAEHFRLGLEQQGLRDELARAAAPPAPAEEFVIPMEGDRISARAHFVERRIPQGEEESEEAAVGLERRLCGRGCNCL